MKTNIKANLNSLQLSDIYSLMLFLLYKVRDLPEYLVLSDLCYLLDSSSLTRFLTYFGGKTISIPTQEEFAVLIGAMLLYQHINIENDSLTAAQAKLTSLAPKQREQATDLYLKIIPLLNQYSIDKAGIQKNG